MKMINAFVNGDWIHIMAHFNQPVVADIKMPIQDSNNKRHKLIVKMSDTTNLLKLQYQM